MQFGLGFGFAVRVRARVRVRLSSEQDGPPGWGWATGVGMDIQVLGGALGYHDQPPLYRVTQRLPHPAHRMGGSPTLT